MTSFVGLASGKRECQAPFTRIAEKQSQFIDKRYLPRGVILDAPRSMKRDSMIKFFEHIDLRQAANGIRDAFKFKAILSSRKRGVLCDTKYPEPASEFHVHEMTPAPVPAPVLTPVPQSSPALALAVTPVTTPTPEPASALRPRPRPRPTGKAKEHSRGMNSHDILFNNALTLDPEFIRDPPLNLEPSLDPDHMPFTQEANWLTVFNESNSQHTSRRRGRSADLLAIEEAEIFLSKGKYQG